MDNLEELIATNKFLDNKLHAIWMDAQILWSEYNMNLSILYDIVITAPMWLKNKIQHQNEGQKIYLRADEIKVLQQMLKDNLDLLNRDVCSVAKLNEKSEALKIKFKELLKDFQTNEKQIIEAYKEQIKTQIIKENYHTNFTALGDIAKSKNEINSALNEFELKKQLLNIYFNGAKEIELDSCILMKNTLEQYNEAFTTEFIKQIYILMQDTYDIIEKGDKQVEAREVDREKE